MTGFNGKRGGPETELQDECDLRIAKTASAVETAEASLIASPSLY
jgi:hypothetical protein